MYVCRSVTEGNQLLQQARSLLQTAGLDLKNEDGTPVNLKRQGAKVEILGFQVSYQDGRMRYGLGKKAWKNLEQRLEGAQEAANPGKAAIAVVRGWLSAYGPAFESEAEDRRVLEGVRQTAARAGVRELGKEAELLGWLRGARQRWRAIRERVLGPLGSQEALNSNCGVLRAERGRLPPWQARPAAPGSNPRGGSAQRR